MLTTTPIYSVPNECQDCYKCIRQCPVKAIQVIDGHARVMPGDCLLCGHCVEVCPSGAKRVRDDIGRAKALLAERRMVLISLAPSHVSEFPGSTPSQLVAACQSIGFSGISETALGAQQVSAQLATILAARSGQLFLSSACPVAVRYIQTMLPHLAEHIMPVASPLLAHAKLLHARYGEDLGIVFVGPCIAKKLEAERHPDLINVALTYAELRQWFADEEIVLHDMQTSSDDAFVPFRAEEGGMYPIAGGMNHVTRTNCVKRNTRFISISGIQHIATALGKWVPQQRNENLFVELLACEGGCINGPAVSARSPITAQLCVEDSVTFPPPATFPRPVEVALNDTFNITWSEAPVADDAALREVLRGIGKHTAHDELNCGGCGYDSCSDFAAAILAGKAETNMCVSYMRQLAQKKVNMLFRTMPYGVVIIDKHQNIIECNEQFARLVGASALALYDAAPGMEGTALGSILPFAELFQQVLGTGEELMRRNVRLQERLLSASIFSVDPHRVVGAILLDVTDTEVYRKEIITKARQVISNTLANAQEIAFLMGKNAAESECILNSVIEGFLTLPEDEAR